MKVTQAMKNRLHKTMTIPLLLFLLSGLNNSYPSSSSLPQHRNQFSPYIVAGAATTATAAWILFYLQQKSIVENIKQTYVIYTATLNEPIPQEQKINMLIHDIFKGKTLISYYEDILRSQQRISAHDILPPFPASHPVVLFVEQLEQNITRLQKIRSSLLRSSVGIFWLFGLREDIDTTSASLKQLSDALKKSQEYINETNLIQAPDKKKHKILVDIIVQEYEKLQQKPDAQTYQPFQQ